MKDIKLTVTINRPVRQVFDFTINPENTPKWIDGVVKEQASETPAKLGTVYKSQGRDGSWRELKISGFEPGTVFTMDEKDSGIHVKYTFKPLGDNQCGLEYCVWADNGDICEPFTQDNLQGILQKLKNVIEAPKAKIIADIYKAAGIVIQDHKLLFTRADGMDFFIDPGGKIEPGETAEQALVRELKEELDITVSEADLEPFGEFTAEAANHKGKTVHMQAFIVKKWAGTIKASAEVKELRWLTSDIPTDIQVGSIFGGKVLPRLKQQGLVD
ncbi:MAG TPA: NUDIX domain-containing protein [Patescibacteria group bacterium]|nr:NUDIX domain-containing protein [Patescibacteria group bacterium]